MEVSPEDTTEGLADTVVCASLDIDMHVAACRRYTPVVYIDVHRQRRDLGAIAQTAARRMTKFFPHALLLLNLG